MKNVTYMVLPFSRRNGFRESPHLLHEIDLSRSEKALRPCNKSKKDLELILCETLNVSFTLVTWTYIVCLKAKLRK